VIFLTDRASQRISTATQGEAKVHRLCAQDGACKQGQHGEGIRVGASNARDGAGHTLASEEDGGRLAPQFKTFKNPSKKTRLTCDAGFPNIGIPEPPFAFVGLTGVARDIARAIAATAEGGPRRLRVNPAPHTELSGVRGDKTHLPVIASQNGNRENSVCLPINLKPTMLRGAPVRGAPTF